MTDYSERVKALRVCGSIRYGIRCISCPYNGNGCHEKLCTDAADAIEALQAQLPKRGEIVRCRDCKWYQEGYDIDGKWFSKCDGSVRTYGHTTPDWFCADGERKVQE